ncbi:hypothetical protein V6N13_123915 [Hibiscus sabdariffa]
MRVYQDPMFWANLVRSGLVQITCGLALISFVGPQLQVGRGASLDSGSPIPSPPVPVPTDVSFGTMEEQAQVEEAHHNFYKS